MPATHLVFISRFRLQSDPQAVWRMLTEAAPWPHWWPGLRQASRGRVDPSIDDALDADASNHRRGFDWHSAFAITAPLHLNITFLDPPRLIEGRVPGHWMGSALWLVEPLAGESAIDVTLRWECGLHRPWMRRLTWLIRPALASCHFNSVRAGARAMATRLGCRLSGLSGWSGGPH